MSAAVASSDGIAKLGVAGLYLFALAAVWKTAPGHVGSALALLAALYGIFVAARCRWDAVSTLTAVLAGWLVLRALLQWLGVGEPALFDRAVALEDWLAPLMFAPLAALPAKDRLERVGLLWLLATVGCVAGIVGFLQQRGVGVLWSGERLGFHLDRPLGIGLYAGCFLIVAAGCWRRWWYAARWRWPVRALGIAALVLFFEVLITAQNRSTYLGLALVGSLAVGGWLWSVLRGTLSGRRRARILAAGAFAIAAGLALVGANHGVVQQRLGAEQDVLQAIETVGLDAAPASSISARFHLWQYAIERFADAPWIGHGLGNLEAAVERDLRSRVALAPHEAYDHVHNSYLQTLWSQGLVGLALWALLLAALLRDVAVAARRDRRVRALLPTVGGVLGFVAVWAFFDYRLSHPDMRFFTILLLLSLRLLGKADEPADPATRTALR